MADESELERERREWETHWRRVTDNDEWHAQLRKFRELREQLKQGPPAGLILPPEEREEHEKRRRLLRQLRSFIPTSRKGKKHGGRRKGAGRPRKLKDKRLEYLLTVCHALCLKKGRRPTAHELRLRLRTDKDKNWNLDKNVAYYVINSALSEPGYSRFVKPKKRAA
jgi:hypothetical protein